MQNSTYRPTALFSALAVAALLALPAQAANMSKTDYTDSKSRLSDTAKAEKKACDSLGGNAKDVCVKAATAIEVRGLADAKLGKKITEAQTDATQSKRTADYKLAAEKCDAMSGDAKSACVASAKSRFGMN